MKMSSEQRAPSRILIVLMGSLGDVVRGLYVVDAIKNSVANAHVTWLVEPANADMVRLHPRVDDVLVFERRMGIRGVYVLHRELRKRAAFDITLDLQRHLKSGVFSWLSGSPRRIGFHPKDAKEGNWLFNTEYVPQCGESIPKIDHYLLFVERLGISRPARLSSGLEDVPITVTAGLQQRLEGPYVALVLGSSWDSKDWPEDGYRELMSELLARGQERVVLLGDRTKSDMAERMVAAAGQRAEAVINVVGQTTLSDLVSVVRGAEICVGPDSGPAHIAGAVGTPHITLFGPTPAIRNAPRGSEGLTLVSSVGCSPCKRRVCPGLGKVCMRLLSPQAVVALVGQVRGQ